MLQLLLQTRLRDNGPVYAETDLSRVIVEPFNGLSAALFLLIVAYWALRLRGAWRRHLFMAAALPVLAIGGIGGTIYHTFRIHEFFLAMDWMPIMILTLAASVYFLIRAIGNWIPAVGIVLGFFFLQGFVYSQFDADPPLIPRYLIINLGYAMMGTLVLLSVGWLLVRTRFAHARWIYLAVLSFALALFFRTADSWGWLPMGTHFLWHLFGAAASHCVLGYLYYLNEPAPKPEPAALSQA
ncbi:MAG: hypothetical protein NW241_20795 [Bacteroidia bacterium]|nr:hypothetical protein [Bacteroidia bacterium]